MKYLKGVIQLICQTLTTQFVVAMVKLIKAQNMQNVLEVSRNTRMERVTS